MQLPRWFAISGIIAVLFALSVTNSEARRRRVLDDDTVMTIERLLLPRAVADRIQGSGIQCRSRLFGDGALFKLTLAQLRLHLNEEIAVRAGIGMARHTRLPLEPEQGGAAAVGGISYTFWERDRFSLAIDASAMRAVTRERAMLDATVLVAFHGY